MTIEIKAVTAEDDNRWDDFVFKHPGGSIYHHSTWRQVLQLTYGYQPLYLALQNGSGGDLHGLYPFMLVKSRLTGDRLVSLPFSSFCAPLVADPTVAEMVHFSLARYPRIDYLEMKLCDGAGNAPDFLEKHTSYVTHLLDLSVGESALLKSFHPSSVRQRIIGAAKNQLTLRMGQSEDDLKNFFKLHTAVRKKHGLPPHPYQFFFNMWKLMSPKKMLLMPFIEYRGKMICGAIVLKYKETVSFEYSASDEEYLSLSGNQMLTWEVIRMACSEGLTCFDFGRSSLDNPSLIAYKDRWATKRCALNYYYYPKARAIGVEGSLGRQLLSRANRMLPDRLLQLEGKYLYRHLG